MNPLSLRVKQTAYFQILLPDYLVEMLFKVGPSFQCEKNPEKSKIFADVSKNKQIFLFFTLFYRFSFLIKKFLCYLERISQLKYKLHVLQHFCEKFQAISFTISGVIGHFIIT